VWSHRCGRRNRRPSNWNDHGLSGSPKIFEGNVEDKWWSAVSYQGLGELESDFRIFRAISGPRIIKSHGELNRIIQWEIKELNTNPKRRPAILREID
jgi:hypothetical protein